MKVVRNHGQGVTGLSNVSINVKRLDLGAEIGKLMPLVRGQKVMHFEI